MLVDQRHVSDSNLTVIRSILKRAKPGAWRKLEPSVRREILRGIVERHDANRDCHASVLRGS